MNEELHEWNEQIDRARATKLAAMETAMRHRGLRRRVLLAIARWLGKIEAMGARWRNQSLQD